MKEKTDRIKKLATSDITKTIESHREQFKEWREWRFAKTKEANTAITKPEPSTQSA